MSWRMGSLQELGPHLGCREAPGTGPWVWAVAGLGPESGLLGDGVVDNYYIS